jgi:hypothetical protein
LPEGGIPSSGKPFRIVRSKAASSLYFSANALPLMGLSGIMALLPLEWQPAQYAFLNTFSPRCSAVRTAGGGDFDVVVDVVEDFVALDFEVEFN